MDLKFKKDGHCFKLRSAAIIVEDGFLLVAKNELAEYYYTIGGGIQLSEQAEDAVKREVFEETGVHYDIDHLAVVLENFFIPRSGPLKGMEGYIWKIDRHKRKAYLEVPMFNGMQNIQVGLEIVEKKTY